MSRTRPTGNIPVREQTRAPMTLRVASILTAYAVIEAGSATVTHNTPDLNPWESPVSFLVAATIGNALTNIFGQKPVAPAPEQPPANPDTTHKA